MTRCCCGKVSLEGGIPLIINGYQHEELGPTHNMCSTRDRCERRDDHLRIKDLENLCAEALSIFKDETESHLCDCEWCDRVRAIMPQLEEAANAARMKLSQPMEG